MRSDPARMCGCPRSSPGGRGMSSVPGCERSWRCGRCSTASRLSSSSARAAAAASGGSSARIWVCRRGARKRHLAVDPIHAWRSQCGSGLEALSGGERIRRMTGRSRRACDQERGAARESTRRPARAAAVGLHAAGIRRVARPCTCSRASPASSTCGGTAPRSGPRSSSCSTGSRHRRPRRLRRRLDVASAARSSLIPTGSGRYHSYLCDEIVPFVDERYELEWLSRGRRQVERRLRRRGDGDAPARPLSRLRQPRRRRALRGLDPARSSGSRRGGCATPTSGSIERFLEELRTGPAPLAHPHDLHVLLQWGFSAAYSADEDGTIRLPYEIATAQVIPELWERWLEWDYPTLVPRHADALRGMTAIYVDVGHERRVVPRPRPRSGCAAS